MSSLCISLVLVRMHQDGHPSELLLHVVNAGVGVHLQHLEGVEVPVGVTRLGESLNLSCWGKILISLLNLTTKYLLIFQ